MTRYRVGVDIGGTFTDIVFLGEHGRRLTKKVSSTVDNYATAIVDGLAELIREYHLDDAEIVELLHGTTVASTPTRYRVMPIPRPSRGRAAPG